jgi:hypothetical protein
MPIQHAVWRVGPQPTALLQSTLQTEHLLEEMIVAEPSILSDGWMLIGRQVRTSNGGYVDLLAIDADGELIIIELKRHQTPRDVIAQALDYASWVENLTPEKIAEVYQSFAKGASLDEAFQKRFGIELDEDKLDGSHQIVIVAAALDASTERIVHYLSDKDVPINIVFFQVFRDEASQFLSRSWLIDPIETEKKAVPSKREEKGAWNGEFYVAFGHDQGREWEDARRFGFISAGGGAWYTRTMALLSPGDRIWVLVPKRGYVGVGIVKGPAVRARDFFVATEEGRKHIFDVTKASYHREYVDDDQKTEMFVPVEWLQTRPLKDSFNEVGLFGNQNTVCQPKTLKWNHTIDRLKQAFHVADA